MSDAAGPTERDMSYALNKKVLGFAGFGLAVRAFQLAIMGKPYGHAPVKYLYNALGWGGVGYVWFHAELRQKQLLRIAEKELSERRASQREALAARNMAS